MPIDVVDGKGKSVEEISASDLEVVVGNGLPASAVDLGRMTPDRPWRIVLYFDRVTSGTRSLRAAADVLSEQLPALVASGEVEVVVAEPAPRELVPPTRSAAALEEALAQLFVTVEGRDDLREGRARFAARAAEAGSVRRGGEAEEALAAEQRTALRQQDRFLTFLAQPASEAENSTAPPGPRAVVLVSDGYDLDPAPAYGLSQAGIPPLDRAARATADAAADLGWTVFALRLGDEKLPDTRRWGLAPMQGGLGGRVTLPVPGPPVPLERALPSLADPEAPLRLLTEASGGAMAASRGAVSSLIASLSRRWLLTWDGPEIAPGTGVPLEIRVKKAGRFALAPRRLGTGVPAEVAAARGRSLLAGDDLDLDFDLKAERVSEAESSPAAPAPTPNAEPSARIEARMEKLADDPALRFTRLADLLSPPQALEPPSSSSGDPAAVSSEVRVARWPLAPSDPGRGVLIVDDPRTGRLGAALIERPEAEEPAVLAEAEASSSRATAPVRRPKNGLTVRILRPLPGRAAGPVEVEADVRWASEARLERVEFFWDDELQATAYEAPFRRSVPVPRDGTVGFLRVAARLADGTIADDAVLMNAGAAGERVDVRLVEVPVIVTDRDGRPVRGLAREDFRLKRNGTPQEIAGFADAGDLPLTLALAVDSSASMFLKLPRVERAARSLLLSALAPRDRALLIDFDSSPRLVSHPTRDLASVAEALSSLSADGGTALWSAVSFGLSELSGVAGRKALVVYSDGVGEEDPTSYGECLRAARSARVPVYLVLSASLSARKAGSLLREPLGEKLERLARATGGDAIFLDASLGADPGPTDDLSSVYRRILAELRSQYVLTFYPPEGSSDSWQDLAVEVKKPGLSARALEGYVPRHSR